MHKTSTLIAELESLVRNPTDPTDPARAVDAARLAVSILRAHEQAFVDIEKRLQALERASRDTE